MGGKSPEFTDEEVVSETVYEGEAPPPDLHENEHLHPHSRGIVRGHENGGNGGSAPVPATAPKNAVLLRAETSTAKVTMDNRQTRIKIAEARLKGYEGDPCGGCGAFTLVRNGTCLKCVSCGATSGCS
jgi:ribonucleoside-diphosphate reductase alpha chain